MKIKRYVAADMRAALRAIRDEQGPDAVILSTRQTSGGVEVCSAVDVELAAGQGTLGEAAALKQLERAALQELERDGARAAAGALRVPGGSLEVAADRGVVEELRSLRNLLEQQLAALAWNDFTRREPQKARALADLAQLGIERTLALQVVGDLPGSLTEEQAQRTPYAMLARRIKVVQQPLPRTGAMLMFGLPGAGKTSLLSKLAARYVLEYDAADLVLVSTDDERLGSQEQLRSLGRVLGVRVECVASDDELLARVQALGGRLVLIDTPGLPARSAEAAARYGALRRRCSSLQFMLVLAASAQSGVIDEAVQHFGAVAHCCSLTRTDESVSLGGAISALVRSQLPVAFVSDGPAIPDDLKQARAHQIVAQAMELSRQAQGFADDEVLARRYGASVHAAG